jgi:hypothetical protein
MIPTEHGIDLDAPVYQYETMEEWLRRCAVLRVREDHPA